MSRGNNVDEIKSTISVFTQGKVVDKYKVFVAGDREIDVIVGSPLTHDIYLVHFTDESLENISAKFFTSCSVLRKLINEKSNHLLLSIAESGSALKLTIQSKVFERSFSFGLPKVALTPEQRYQNAVDEIAFIKTEYQKIIAAKDQQINKLINEKSHDDESLDPFR